MSTRTFWAILLICLSLSGQLLARVSDDQQVRENWVKQLREFLLDLERQNPEFVIVINETSFKFKINLISEAMAEKNHECFFAGWPSTLVKSGSRKLCQNPINGNSNYQNGECKAHELQCQPLLFGKNVCVSFAQKKDKQMAFASCDKKFKKNGSNDFLKNLNGEEKADLKEISVLAHRVCVSGEIGIQKSKPMCDNLISKFSESMKAIERAPASEIVIESEENEEPIISDPELMSLSFESSLKNDLVCEEPLVVDKNIENESQKIITIVNHSENTLYDQIKTEFLKSPLCAPDKVLNNPKEKLSPLLFSQLLEDMRFMVKSSPVLTRSVKRSQFIDIAKNYELSDETIKYGVDLIENHADTNEGRFEAMARLRGVMLQNMEQVSKTKEGYQSEFLKEELMNRKIFVEDENGSPECPFVSQEAFKQALLGRETVLKSSQKSKISNPNLITIVDYTRPSNERRMFVIDLSSKAVIHNTWSAHGGGKDRSQDSGNDGFGSSPKMSNDPGSLLSSEGFYVAKQASSGGTYLNNVTLEGIDSHNSSMGSRAIVIHGWRTPNQEYVNKTWEIDEKSKKRIEGKDIYKSFMNTNFKNTKEDLFDLTQILSSASAARPRIDATDGCLGVPDTNMKHVDRKGRDKSQLELLREDLPGTLMFNYKGPETKSKFLN